MSSDARTSAATSAPSSSRRPGDGAQRSRGYHKPIMIAGGLGNIRREQVHKGEVPLGAKLVVLGGPAMLIGLGGGAASSMASGSSSADLDFASVQRGNPEIERRAQEVIDRCWALGCATIPSRSSTMWAPAACPMPCPKRWRTASAARGSICGPCPSGDPGMSPLEIWCNEAQERYVIALQPGASSALPTLRARALSVCRDRRDQRQRRAAGQRSAAGRHPGGHADRGAAGQGPAHASRGAQHAPGAASHSIAAALDLREAMLRVLRCPTRGRQDLPDLHRRPHRGRHDQPRPDGRALAGSGQRCRRHASATIWDTPGRRWPWASARRWRC